MPVAADTPSRRRHTKGFPDDPCFRYQWHLNQVGLPAAWKLGQGRGVVVAVIDTGVTQVPDLAGIELVQGLQLRRQRPERRRRPRARHPRGGHHRAGDQQPARRGGRGLRRQDHAAQGALGAGLGLDGRDRPGDPLRRRPRRAGHQHEPGRALPGRRHPQRGQVRQRKGRDRGGGRGQRRARQGGLPGQISRGFRGGRDPVRRDHDLLFELGRRAGHRGPGRQRPRRPERRRQARRGPAKHGRPRQRRARPTT